MAKGKWLLVEGWLRKLDKFNVTKLFDLLAGVSTDSNSHEQDCSSLCANIILDLIDRSSKSSLESSVSLKGEDLYQVEQALTRHAHKMKHANLDNMVRNCRESVQHHHVSLVSYFSPFLSFV